MVRRRMTIKQRFTTRIHECSLNRQFGSGPFSQSSHHYEPLPYSVLNLRRVPVSVCKNAGLDLDGNGAAAEVGLAESSKRI